MYKKILALKNAKLYLVIYFLGYLFFALFNAIFPLFIGYLINNIIPSKNQYSLQIWIVVSISFAIFLRIYSFAVPNFLFFKFELVLTKLLGFDLFKKYLNIKIYEFEKYEVGRLLNTLGVDTSAVTGIILQQIVRITTNIISIFIYFYILLSISKPLCLVILCSIPFYILVMFLNNRKLQNIQAKQTFFYDKNTSIVKHIISNKKQINILKSDKYFDEIYKESSNFWINYRIKYWFWVFMTEEMPSLISSITKYLCLFLGANAIIKGNFQVGSLVVVVTYIDLLMNPVNDIVQILIRKKANQISFDRTSELFNLKENDEAYESLLIADKDYVNIKNVDILNRDESLLFSIEELIINKNGIYQLIGENGCGKSTFLNILLNINESKYIKLKSEFSKVEINKDIINITSYLSYPHLFVNDTAEENILMGNTKPSNFDEIINMLNIDFLDKVIDINTVNLSLGQQQKISLARILLMPSKVLILDEPIANIDLKTLNNMVYYLSELKKDKIIIIVSHDKHFDNIRDYLLTIKANKLIVS